MSYLLKLNTTGDDGVFSKGIYFSITPEGEGGGVNKLVHLGKMGKKTGKLGHYFIFSHKKG